MSLLAGGSLTGAKSRRSLGGAAQSSSLRDALRARGGAKSFVPAAPTDIEDNKEVREKGPLDWLNLQALAPKALQSAIERLRAGEPAPPPAARKKQPEPISETSATSGAVDPDLSTDGGRASSSSSSGHTGLRSALQVRGGIRRMSDVPMSVEGGRAFDLESKPLREEDEESATSPVGAVGTALLLEEEEAAGAAVLAADLQQAEDVGSGELHQAPDEVAAAVVELPVQQEDPGAVPAAELRLAEDEAASSAELHHAQEEVVASATAKPLQHEAQGAAVPAADLQRAEDAGAEDLQGPPEEVPNTERLAAEEIGKAEPGGAKPEGDAPHGADEAPAVQPKSERTESAESESAHRVQAESSRGPGEGNPSRGPSKVNVRSLAATYVRPQIKPLVTDSRLAAVSASIAAAEKLQPTKLVVAEQTATVAREGPAPAPLLAPEPPRRRDTASEECGKLKELREFWGAKNSVGFAGPQLGGTRLSQGEAQAALQRLIAAGNAMDFDEIRRLRKLIAEIE